MRSTRRSFLTVTGAAAALALTGSLPEIKPAAAGWTGRPDRRDPFTLGVASGDPLPDAVVIWTRLAPKPYEPLGGAPYKEVGVDWQVATDDRFQHIVRSGRATARPEFTASTEHVPVYPACGAVDGDRDSEHWGLTTGWNDASKGLFPDWLQVTFDQPQSIGRVDLYTLDSKKYPAAR